MELILFKKVFNNIVILRLIYKYVRLYTKYIDFFKRNEKVKFENRRELLGYEEKEFIETLWCSGKEVIKAGDLPRNGVLKELRFYTAELSAIKGDAIPNGVELIQYAISERKITTPFSTLPNSIHTILNAVVVQNKDNHQYNIPPNITSISFNKCPNISGNNDNGNGYIKIPNNIKSLEFHIKMWNNENIPLKESDIPNSITKLSLSSYQIKNLSKGILPNSIKELSITCKNEDSATDEKYVKGLFDFLPLGVETLTINNCNCLIKPISNLMNCTSINKFTIVLENQSRLKVKSLPRSVTDLTILRIDYNIDLRKIPRNVANLNLNFVNNYRKYIFLHSIPKTVIKTIFI